MGTSGGLGGACKGLDMKNATLILTVNRDKNMGGGGNLAPLEGSPSIYYFEGV